MRLLHALHPQLLIAALLVYLVASGSSCNFAPLHDGEQTVTTAHVANAPLQVETTNGSITVSKRNRADVAIVAKISALSAERLAAAKVVATRGIDDTLTVRCEWPGGQPKSREACSFDVEVPDAVGVRLMAENGNVHVSDLAGQADLVTTNGNVEVDRHAGPIRANTTNGSVTIADAGGPVKTATTNGTIDVALAPNSTGPIEADGVNSTIDLAIGPSFAGSLSLGAINGLVTIDPSLQARATNADPHEMQLVFGSTEQKSSATTVNGTVHVRTIATTSDNR